MRIRSVLCLGPRCPCPMPCICLRRHPHLCARSPPPRQPLFTSLPPPTSTQGEMRRSNDSTHVEAVEDTDKVSTNVTCVACQTHTRWARERRTTRTQVRDCKPRWSTLAVCQVVELATDQGKACRRMRHSRSGRARPRSTSNSTSPLLSVCLLPPTGLALKQEQMRRLLLLSCVPVLAPPRPHTREGTRKP